MIILGIDPGTITSGYGIISKQANKIILLDYGYLPMSSKTDLSRRIGIFYEYFKDKILKYSVDAISLETPFLGKNSQSFLKLGYLRGILYLLADQNNLKLFEFAPREVKLTLGFGGADKDMVAKMVLRFFPEIGTVRKLDVTDALAIALCGLWRSQSKLANL